MLAKQTPIAGEPALPEHQPDRLRRIALRQDAADARRLGVSRFAQSCDAGIRRRFGDAGEEAAGGLRVE